MQKSSKNAAAPIEEEKNQAGGVVYSFKDVGLALWLTKNLKEVGIEKPTQIQYDTLKHSLKGKNVIGCAYTGSGKTACFALPVL